MIELGDVKFATQMASYRRGEAIRFAEYLKTDPDVGQRLARRMCAPCFYGSPSISGQAFTAWACKSCDKEQEEWPNTAHPQICKDCSLKYDICMECLADLDLKDRKVLERR